VKLWPFVAAPIAAVGVYFGVEDVFKAWPGYVDWPNGASSAIDFWRGGAFLGYKADRIRRVWSWRKVDCVLGESPQPHVYFASIAIPASELRQHLIEWRADPFCRRYNSKILEVVPPHWPPWFPKPSKDAYIGSLVDDGGYISLYQQPGEDKLFLWFEG